MYEDATIRGELTPHSIHVASGDDTTMSVQLERNYTPVDLHLSFPYDGAAQLVDLTFLDATGHRFHVLNYSDSTSRSGLACFPIGELEITASSVGMKVIRTTVDLREIQEEGPRRLRPIQLLFEPKS